MPTPVPPPRTLYDKIWDDHVVRVQDDGTTLLYADRHIIHEVSTPQAFDGLRAAGRGVRRPDCTLATVDHNTPTDSRATYKDADSFISDAEARHQVKLMEQNVQEFGLVFYGLADKRQGICHIIGPEQGFTIPGAVVVCGDSHTSTHGAFGALAFGIGTTEVQHVLATQCTLQRKAKNMRIQIDGVLSAGVTSKDVILHIIGEIGTAGGTGHVIEYCGEAVRSMSMEARMSMCNMSIEAGARAGMVAPDEITFSYLKGRPLAPQGALWDPALQNWSQLHSDANAKWDAIIHIRAEDIAPTITWGTSPQEVVPITGRIPYAENASTEERKRAMERMLEYMGLVAGTPVEDIKIDRVFIGSCTNSRIEDLRAAAAIAYGRKVAPHVYAMVAPGSGNIKLQAESEGLDRIFKEAGFDWREAGCSMCLGMNPDQLKPGERCASTSNRNFEGRQGVGGRTHLMNPAMAAAAAIAGKFEDVRKMPPLERKGVVGHVGVEVPEGQGEFAPMATPNTKYAEKYKASLAAKEGKVATKTAAQGGIPKFVVWSGVAAPLDMSNVDTDQVCPKNFLKKIQKKGLANALFYPMRFDAVTGAEKPDFVLNKEPWRHAKILVARENFGCGSSREHAPWCLEDFGIRCIIAESFAEIFNNNCYKNGMLPVVLTKDQVELCMQEAKAGHALTIDLPNQVVILPNGSHLPFDVQSHLKNCLINGWDDITLTMHHIDEIAKFEQHRSAVWPWLDGNGYLSRDAQGRIAVLAEGRTDW